jgi:hypothetical protein
VRFAFENSLFSALLAKNVVPTFRLRHPDSAQVGLAAAREVRLPPQSN